MILFKSAALAAVTLAIASPALAQNDLAQTGPGQSARPQASSASPLANDGPYAGASPTDFYHPDARITQLRAEISQGALVGARAKHALAALATIHQDLQFRIARHNGDLRDWDRELINQKLDALVKQYPALRS
jgi:hypothetical protein